jgi:hypothetical protein
MREMLLAGVGEKSIQITMGEEAFLSLWECGVDGEWLGRSDGNVALIMH